MKPYTLDFKFSGNPFDDRQEYTGDVSLNFDQDIMRSLKRFSSEAQISLIEGEHAINASGRSAIFGVAPGTTAHVEFSVSSHDGMPVLDRLLFRFSAPIRLLNIFTTLDEIGDLLAESPSKIFPDIDVDNIIAGNEILSKASSIIETNAKKFGENARRYAGLISNTSAWKRLKNAAERGHLSENFEKSKEYSKSLLERSQELAESALDRALETVELSALEITADPDDDGKKIGLSFFITGEVALSAKIRREFDHARIPDVFLPAFDACIPNLLNQFCVDREQGGNLSKTFLAMIHDIAGTDSAEIEITPIPISFGARGGWQCTAEINAHDMLKCTAEYDIARISDIFSVNIRVGLGSEKLAPCAALVNFQVTPENIVALGHAFTDQWTTSIAGKGTDIEGCIHLRHGFSIVADSILLRADSPLVKDTINLNLNLDKIPVSGSVGWGIDIEKRSLHLHALDIESNGNFKIKQDEPLNFHGCTTSFNTCECLFASHAVRNDAGQMTCSTKIDALYDIDVEVPTPKIPEFGIKTDKTGVHAVGALFASVNLRADNTDDKFIVVDLDKTCVETTCTDLHVKCAPLEIALDTPANAGITVQKAALSLTGISDCDFALDWSFPKSPEIRINGRCAELLPEDLCCGDIDASLSESGILEFRGGNGFYNADFFNTLLRPNAERENWVKILKHAPLFSHIMQICDAAVFPRIPGSEKFCRHLFDWIDQCEKLGIFSINAIIHPENLARVLSLLLFGDESAVGEILPSIQRAYNADGIDRFKLEEIFDRAFPNANFDNLGRILKWLQHLFETVPYTTPKKTHLPALCDDPHYVDEIIELPTANEIYDGDWSSGNIPDRAYRYASGFTIEQLRWILDNHADDFPTPKHRENLRILLKIKERIHSLEPREGTLIMQDFNISVFLDRLLRGELALLDETPRDDADITSCFTTWLAPADLGCMISAGIASRYHGLIVQINQTRLFDYLLRRGRHYARAVFYELGQHSTRVLTNLLMSWLVQDQSLLKKQTDRAQKLSEILDIPVPSAADYTLLGPKQTESYIDAIFTAADAINASNQLYSAACLRIQTYRVATEDAPATAETPKAAPVDPAIPDPVLEAELAEAIQNADRKTSELLGDDPCAAYAALDKDQRFTACEIWRSVIVMARDFASCTCGAWTSPVFKNIWMRVFEALRIASVESDIDGDLDETRIWLACRLGTSPDIAAAMPRAERVRAIIDHIYARPEDRARILADPVTWFAPKAPAGNVDLTLITTMGIITDGASGHELETVFQRLKKSRNINLIRTNTGTIKPIRYNAVKIIDVLKDIHSPFAFVGYSQGCPNMMFVESLLRTGTPDQRKILDNLVSRNFICSAFNGSPHAICGVDKYRNALVEGESIIKTLSVTISTPLTRLILSFVQRFLDNPLITASLCSVEAISHEGLAELSRDAQYTPGIPNVETLGMTRELPEGLIIMGSHFDKQGGVPNDSQVGIDCAHAYPVYNENDAVDILKTETFPSALLNIHHWSPLIDEIKFIESELDIRNCLYKSPKSLYLTPWIDALILFGFLRIS